MLIYKCTKYLLAVQLLFGYFKLESIIRYLGIEIDDALEISEQTEIFSGCTVCGRFTCDCGLTTGEAPASAKAD